MHNRIACNCVKQFLPFQPFSQQGYCRVLWMKSHFLDCQSFQVGVKLLLQQAYDLQQLIPPYYEDVHQGSMSAAFPTVEKPGAPLIICIGKESVSVTNVIDIRKFGGLKKQQDKQSRRRRDKKKKVLNYSRAKIAIYSFASDAMEQIMQLLVKILDGKISVTLNYGPCTAGETATGRAENYRPTVDYFQMR